MKKWIWVAFVILEFFAVAAVVPGDHGPISLLAAHVTGHDLISLRWASAIAAVSGDSTKVTLTEFLYTLPGRLTSAWFTLAGWPSPRVPGTLVLTPSGRWP